MNKDLVTIEELITSLEASAIQLERSTRRAKGFSEAYARGRIQGIRDCVVEIKELFYVHRKREGRRDAE